MDTRLNSISIDMVLKLEIKNIQLVALLPFVFLALGSYRTEWLLCFGHLHLGALQNNEYSTSEDVQIVYEHLLFERKLINLFGKLK